MKIKSTLCLLAAVLCLAITGCGSTPSKAHVVRAVTTGTTLGVTQNPSSGLYELGIKRVQAEIVTIPVWFTNGVFYTPDVVSRYEVNTHSAVFGNASLTSTLSTGPSAVQTPVGGSTPPINSNVGTGSNLTPLSH